MSLQGNNRKEPSSCLEEKRELSLCEDLGKAKAKAKSQDLIPNAMEVMSPRVELYKLSLQVFAEAHGQS